MTARTLGNYQILDKLGSGGMGEVYKARDTRLNRLVAIKLLRADTLAVANPRHRFIQEAQSASALNHPNIVTIYEFFQHEGMDCLVMEYIAGKTLDKLIPPQGMRLKEALRIAAQIAEGLAKAHAAGIVHRDIKPSNVMAPASGPVKILDFGLAKLTEFEPLKATDPTRITAPATEQGAVVGTVFYMSPEQAEGKPVDCRSDIFSFGSLLYEMLTGRRAFQENSAIGTLAAILHNEPDVFTDPVVPRELTRIVSRCLRKNPAERWQDMSDVKQLLEDVAADNATAATDAGPRMRDHRRFLWLAVAAVCALSIALAYTIFRAFGAEGSSGVESPAALRMVTADTGLSGYPAISRDGKLVAFASDRGKEDNLDIWLQQIGGREPIRLTRDPEDESDPCFSPDGTMIAFRSEKDGGAIYLVPTLGGSPVLLAPRGRNPRFSPDGRWVAYSVGGEAVSPPGTAGVFIISSGGGVPRTIHPEMATATNPVWSPDGTRLLVLGRKDGKAPARAELDWWILPIDADAGGAPVRTGAYARINAQKLMETQFPQVFPAALDWRQERGDQILFSGFLGEAANLWEIPLQGKGGAHRLTLGPGLHRHATWSADGHRLVFAAEELNFDVWLQPLDRATGAVHGAMTRLTGEATAELSPSVSWDAGKIAFVSRQPDIWSLHMRDIASGTDRTVLSSQTSIPIARLSGDGTRILYSSSQNDLLSVPSTGGVAQKLCEHCGNTMGASNDGREVLYEPLENEDVLMYDAGRHATEKLAVRPKADLILSSSRFSRDEKWIAFHALHNPTNSARIWIAPAGGAVPAPESSWIAITDGSKMERDPAWSPDGRFIYFLSDRDGFRCIWARALNPLTKQPSGEAFAVRHFHSARLSLRHIGSQGFLTGLSVGEGVLVFSIGELRANVWLEEK